MSHHPPFKQVEASRPPFDTETSYTTTKIVDPDWVPGSGANAKHPKSALFRQSADGGGFKSIKASDLEAGQNYKLLINGVVPRPIAFVSSQDAQGNRNLAPFSYFGVIGHKPPLISVSVNAPGKDKAKDTAANVTELKRFVVNIISEPFIEAANYTSINAPHDVSEWELSGLTPIPNISWGGDAGGPPRVGEAAFSMECELYQAIEIKDDDGTITGTVLLGRVLIYHVRKDIINDDYTIKPEELLPVSRGGGITYFRTLRGFEVPRPDFDSVKDTPEVQEALAKQKGKN